MKIEQLKIKLQTVKNFAAGRGQTTSYIYQQIKKGKIGSVEIDGVKFVKL